VSDPLKIAILVALTALLLAGMAVGWRRRAARAADLVPDLPVVPPLGTPRVGPHEVTYLATARADDRLARVAAHRFAVRAPGEVEVHDAGVLVRRVGAADLFVPAGALHAVTRASGMAGTAVGRDRVVVLRWRHLDATLDTGLLPRHADDAGPLAEAAAALVAHAAPGTNAAGPTDGSDA
jgi:hypothetical protein